MILSHTQSQHEENKIACINYFNTWEIVDRLGVTIPVLINLQEKMTSMQCKDRIRLRVRLYLPAMHKGLNYFFIYPVLFLSSCR